MRTLPFVLGLALLAHATAQQPATTIVDLRGTVRGPGDGKTRVTVWHNDMQKHAIEPIAEGFADAAGKFAFDRVPWFARQQWGPHSIVVVARRAGHAGLCTLRGDDAPTGAVVVDVAPTIELRGTVHGADGKALAGARVWPTIFGHDPNGGGAAWVTAPLLPWLAETAADGTFTLRDLPPLPPFKLRAAHPDHATAWVDGGDGKEPIACTLELGGRIRGEVRLPDGKPAPRVRVAAAAVGVGYAHAQTDLEGRYELHGLPADTYKVWAEAPDLTVVCVTNLVVRAGEIAEADQVQLTPGGFIVGKLVDASTGRPFVPGPWTDIAMYGPARGEGGACECTPVLPDGTFKIRAPAGMNRIYVRGANGYSEPSDYVEVHDGKVTNVEWRLSPPIRKKG
jgi:hypothetical protein